MRAEEIERSCSIKPGPLQKRLSEDAIATRPNKVRFCRGGKLLTLADALAANMRVYMPINTGQHWRMAPLS